MLLVSQPAMLPTSYLKYFNMNMLKMATHFRPHFACFDSVFVAMADLVVQMET
jgi:hypothetical protein